MLSEQTYQRKNLAGNEKFEDKIKTSFRRKELT